MASTRRPAPPANRTRSSSINLSAHLWCVWQLRPDDAAEGDVRVRRIDRLREAGGGPVPPAVVRRAQMRPALQDLARNPDIGNARVVAILSLRSERVSRDAAGLD